MAWTYITNLYLADGEQRDRLISGRYSAANWQINSRNKCQIEDRTKPTHGTEEIGCRATILNTTGCGASETQPW